MNPTLSYRRGRLAAAAGWMLCLAAGCATDSDNGAAADNSRSEWYWNSLVNLHIDNHGRLVGKGRTADEIADHLKRLPVDIVQVSAYGADGAVTTYPSALLARDDLEGWDTLGVWKEAAGKAGKRFHVYINTRGLTLTKQRPEWTQLDAFGKGKGKNNGLDICPRPSPDGSGYLESLLLPLLEEIMVRYRPDGIWVDGDHARTPACYCPSCKAAWQADAGKPEPPVDAADPDWPRWLAFQQNRYDDYRRRMAEVVHRINPDAFYTSNHSWKKITHRFEKDDPRSAPAFADTISADLSHGQALGLTRIKAMSLSPERTTPWDIMNLIYRPMEISRQRVLQQGAVTLAHGGSWFLWTPGADPVAPEAFAWSMDCATFVRDRAEALGRSESINPVAVLVSETAWLNERVGGRAGFTDHIEPQAWAIALQDACYGVDLINETDLNRGPLPYRLIAVPNQRAVSATSLERLRGFAASGGTILLTGSTLREGAADGAVFAELAGAVRGEKREAASAVTAGGRRFVIEGRWALDARDAEVLARWNDDEPLVLARPMGRGRVAYVSADRMPSPDYDGFVPYLMDVLGLGPAVRLSGAGQAEQFVFSFRRKGDRTIVHLADIGSRVNGVRMAEEKTQLIDNTPPVPEVTVHLPMPRPAAVSVVPATTSIRHAWNDGVLTVTLQNIEVHAALIVDATPESPLPLLPVDAPLDERHPLSHIPRADGIDEDFEIASRGQAVTLIGPYDLRSKGRTSIEISDETASSGRHSLKFSDAPMDPSFMPMLVIKPAIAGPVAFACDLKIERGASVWLDIRTQENRREFPVGPSLRFDSATGSITAGRANIGTFPVGAWFTVEIDLPFNDDDAYAMRVLRGGQTEISRTLPFESPDFVKCGWIGVIGLGNETTSFFIDNLRVRRATP